MHDQLLLTGGSDARVNLHSAVSVSSAAFGSGDPEEEGASDLSEEENGAGEKEVLANKIASPTLYNNPSNTPSSSPSLARAAAHLQVTSPLATVPLSRRSSSR